MQARGTARITSGPWREGGTLIRAAVGLAVAGSLLAGCGVFGLGCGSSVGTPACTFPPTAPPNGLSRETAIATARRLAPVTAAAPDAVWATAQRDPFARQGAERWVWEVRLAGAFTAPACPTGMPEPLSPPDGSTPCVDGDGGLVVVLDFYTGALVGWTN